MEPIAVAQLHPRLFHMAEPGALDSIVEHGLLSTASIVAGLPIPESEKRTLTAACRAESRDYTHPELGRIRMRDNKPMRMRMLEQAVVGVTAEEFLGLINSRVFFWPSLPRIQRFLAVYASSAQLVLEFDTRSLLSAHRDDVELSRINSGAVRMVSHKRGRHTFAPMGTVHFDSWRGARPRASAIAEVTVRGQILDAADHLLAVSRVEPGGAVTAMRGVPALRLP